MAVQKDRIESEIQPPVFVLGSARSGTSILSRLLRDYLNVSFGTESQFIIRFYRKLPKYGDLQNDRHLKRLIGDIGRERCFQRWRKFGFQFSAEAVYENIRTRTYAGVLDAIFSDLAAHNRMPRWGDKTPEYIHHLDVLYELFPAARFIHIVRDGRDVALSSFEIHFGAKNIGVAALEWNRQMELIQKFRRVVPADHFLEIRYEDFLNAPVDTFKALMHFLGIADREGAMLKRIETGLPGELKRDNFYKWRTRLSPADNSIFEGVAYDNLRYYGYQTVTSGGAPVSKGESCFG